MKRTGEHARALQDLERGETDAPPAPATAAADVLALQRSAGNRAVAGLLARDSTKSAPKPKDAKPAQATGPRVVFPGIGEIPIESFQWGELRALPPPDREEIGKNQPREILFISKTGDHSSALMRAMLQGEAKEVEVIWPQGSGGAVMRLRLKGALVSSYNVSTGGDEPTESWSLNFEAIEFTHEDAKQD